MKRIFTCFVLVLLPISLLGQVNQTEKEGVLKTKEDGLSVVFDEFTGELNVGFRDFYKIQHSFNDREMLVIPVFMGNIEKNSFFDMLFGDATPQSWVLGFISEPKIFSENINNLVNNADSLSVRFLVDNDRMTVDTYFIPDSSEISSNDNWLFTLSENKWNQIASAKEVKFRIAGKVTQIPDSTLLQMARVIDKVNELRDEKDAEEKEVEETGKEFQENEIEQKDEVSSAPYQLQWEGDLDRTPQVQPLPSNPTNQEATVTIRFQVNPDGSLGQVYPLKEINPELEREVMSTLRSWRFSRLPQGVPHEPQWGTITFRFVLD